MQSLSLETIQKKSIDEKGNSSISNENDLLVSFVQEIPAYLEEAMTAFIEKHPNWDQYRLLQAAISGYLLDKGVYSREINQFYFKSMVCKKVFVQSL
tara:strand:+ start:189 stop:479 length:291 start_codon:yes stop_codon:yes gene_type:complete